MICVFPIPGAPMRRTGLWRTLGISQSPYSSLLRYASTASMISCFARLMFMFSPFSIFHFDRCEMGIRPDVVHLMTDRFQSSPVLQYQLHRPGRYIYVPVILLHKDKDRIVRRHFHREKPIAVRKVDQSPESGKGACLQKL